MRLYSNLREAPRPQLRLVQMLADRGLQPIDLARGARVASGTAWSWVRDERAPQARHRERLDAWLLNQGIDPDITFTFEGTPLKPHLTLIQPPQEEDMPEYVTREFLTAEQLVKLDLPTDPFDDLESEDEIVLNAPLRALEGALITAISSRHLVALTGPIGAGKTTLIRRIAARLASERRIQLIFPATLDRRAITANTLTVAVLRDMTSRDTSSMSPEQRAELLRKTLAEASAAKLFPAIVIDEAHVMTSAALVAVKQIWDSGLLNRQLSAILVGHPELAGRLRKDPAVRELGVRTRVLEVKRYTVAETTAYLRWRFAHVGGDADKAFAANAYEALAARGEYPQGINNFAILALQYALSRGDRQVTATHIGRA